MTGTKGVKEGGLGASSRRKKQNRTDLAGCDSGRGVTAGQRDRAAYLSRYIIALKYLLFLNPLALVLMFCMTLFSPSSIAFVSCVSK